MLNEKLGIHLLVFKGNYNCNESTLMSLFLPVPANLIPNHFVELNNIKTTFKNQDLFQQKHFISEILLAVIV